MVKNALTHIKLKWIKLAMLRGYGTYTSSKFTVDVFLAKCFLPFSHAKNTSDTGIYTSILFQLYVINTSNTGKYTSRLIYMNICLQLIRFCTVCIGFKFLPYFSYSPPIYFPFSQDAPYKTSIHLRRWSNYCG